MSPHSLRLPIPNRTLASDRASLRVPHSGQCADRRAYMNRKVIISCAVTGSADSPGKNPAVPVSPQQIADSCLDAAKAGAAVVHIHVRNPQTTKPSMDGALYR